MVIFSVLAVVACGDDSPVSATAMPVCACTDAAQGVWFLAWPAHALAHFGNPFVTNFAAYPRGVNLMTGTSMELLGIIGAPITLTLGPVSAFNFLLRLAFVSSATSMFLVLRRYVSWWPAALAGGALFGFSPFMLGQGYTHLFLVFLPFPPLVLLLVEDLLVTHKWRPAPAGALLGLVAVGQLLIAAETLAITIVMTAGAVVLLTLRHPVAAGERLRRAAIGLGSGAIVFVVLAAYPIWVFLAGPQHVSAPQHPRIFYSSFHDDLFGTVVPTSAQLIGLRSWFAVGDALTQTNAADHVTYLGAPLLALLLYLVVRYRKVGMIAVMAVVGAVGLVISLGPTLYVDGTGYLGFLRLPYDLLLHVPLLEDVLATRFIVVVYFAAAVILALGLDRLRADGLGWPIRRGGSDGARRREADHVTRAAACGAIACAALLPLVPSAPYAPSAIPVPSFFYNQSLVDRIPAGSVVLPYPNAQRPTVKVFVSPHVDSMMWQAVAGMRFRIIGFYGVQPYDGAGLGQGSELFAAPRVVQQLFGWALYGSPSVRPVRVTPATEAALRRFCVVNDVSTVIVDPAAGHHPKVVVAYVEAALHRPPEKADGVDVWFDVASDLSPPARTTSLRSPN